MNKSNLYLSGGGGAQDSLLLDRLFLNNIDNKRAILYLPIAMEVNLAGFKSCYEWIKETLTNISHRLTDIVMWTDIHNKSWDDIKDFGAIYIGGGNTYKLLNDFYDSGFINVLIKYIVNGGVVYGGSAGAIILGKSIKTVEEENNMNYKVVNGLNLLFGCSVICHYQKTMDANISQYILNNNEGVIALPEKTGLFIVDSEILVVGFESARFFGVNGEVRILEADRKYYFHDL